MTKYTISLSFDARNDTEAACIAHSIIISLRPLVATSDATATRTGETIDLIDAFHAATTAERDAGFARVHGQSAS